MNRLKSPGDKNIETVVQELLDSRAESRIYVYLLRNKGARSDDIIRREFLHEVSLFYFFNISIETEVSDLNIRY